jgi:hypothetical protein
MFAFSNHPTTEDYRKLAAHLRAAPEVHLHPSLWPQQNQVADRLDQMAEEPEAAANQAAYHALRLLVWE